MRISVIRFFAAATLLLVSGAASAVTLTLDYVAEVKDIDGSAAAIQFLNAAGIVTGTDARGTVTLAGTTVDSAPGDPELGIYVGAVVDLSLTLAGAAASFDGDFNDAYVANSAEDILLATGGMTYGNAGFGSGLVGLQLRDSTGSALASDAIPLDDMLNLLDFDTYVPLDSDGSALLLSIDVNGELVTVFAEIKNLQAKVIPVPAAVWLFGCALVALGRFTRKH